METLASSTTLSTSTPEACKVFLPVRPVLPLRRTAMLQLVRPQPARPKARPRVRPRRGSRLALARLAPRRELSHPTQRRPRIDITPTHKALATPSRHRRRARRRIPPSLPCSSRISSHQSRLRLPGRSSSPKSSRRLKPRALTSASTLLMSPRMRASDTRHSLKRRSRYVT